MSKEDAQKAVQIYRVFARQVELTDKYLSVAQDHMSAIGVQIPTFKKISIDLVDRLQSHVMDPNFETMKRQHLAQNCTSHRPNGLNELMPPDTAPNLLRDSFPELEALREATAGETQDPFDDVFEPTEHDLSMVSEKSFHLPYSIQQPSSDLNQNIDLETASGASQTPMAHLASHFGPHAYHLPNSIAMKLSQEPIARRQGHSPSMQGTWPLSANYFIPGQPSVELNERKDTPQRWIPDFSPILPTDESFSQHLIPRDNNHPQTRIVDPQYVAYKPSNPPNLASVSPNYTSCFQSPSQPPVSMYSNPSTAMEHRRYGYHYY